MGKFNQDVFESKANKMVANYCEIGEKVKIDEKDVFMVWFSKVGSNAKAMLSSDQDDRYFEATYIGEEGKYIVDIYNFVGGIVNE